MPSATERARVAGFDADEARRAILEAALPHVPFDGWTQGTLNAAAADAGLDATTVLRVFPGGPAEVVRFWSADADRRMLLALEGMDLASMRTRERVAAAVRARLAPLATHREALRRALALMTLPLNAPYAPQLGWRTVDAIWWAAGDRSTDFNFYTKRALLAGVYGATLLFFLEDRSDGAGETWAFLDRRIADVMAVPKALAGLGERLGKLPNPLAFLAPLVRR
jgi:ubiquinone biosynthesis protein COQ9